MASEGVGDLTTSGGSGDYSSLFDDNDHYNGGSAGGENLDGTLQIGESGGSAANSGGGQGDTRGGETESSIPGGGGGKIDRMPEDGGNGRLLVSFSKAFDDTLGVSKGGVSSVDVLANDIHSLAPANLQVCITNPVPLNGSATIVPTNLVQYQHNPYQPGSDSIHYQLKNSATGKVHATAKVDVTLLPTFNKFRVTVCPST